MGRLLLLRHGESTWNAEGRWQGWADTELSALGRRQAEAAAVWLADRGWAFAGAACSDLARARDTAAVLAAGLGLGTVAVDADLRERDVGHWSGRTTAQIGAGWPGALEAWRAGRLDGPPGGEPDVRFVARVRGALARLAHGAGDGALLVVTHGGVIRALERRAGTVPTGTAAHLGGRWVHADGDGEIRLGEPVAVPAPDEQPATPGR